MKVVLRVFFAFAVFALFSAGPLFSADSKAGSLTCVGLYSETSDGYVSFRTIGKTAWTTMKVGDVIPANAEIKINVDRDWVELTPSNDPNAVYEIDGPDSGETIKSVASILKGKARTVSFPKRGSSPDSKYRNKLVVEQYLGRQVYIDKNGDSVDIKYGMALDASGKVRIIAINNTINLMNATGKVTTVIGPLNFDVSQVLNNEKLYKFLNVQ